MDLNGALGIAGDHHLGDFGGGGGRAWRFWPGTSSSPIFGPNGQRLGITAPGFEQSRWRRSTARRIPPVRKVCGELCSSATELLKARGSDPEPLPIGAKMGLMMSRARNAMSPPSSSKIAEMMITGNTKGAIQSIQHHRQYLGKDERVTDLSKKLLETEQSNIEQMKPFL